MMNRSTSTALCALDSAGASRAIMIMTIITTTRMRGAIG
jgi:hypothetical protein